MPTVRFSLPMLTAALAALAVGCGDRPDLVVISFTKTGPAHVDSGLSTVVLPVRATVMNVGGTSTGGGFKIATDYSAGGGFQVVAFDSPGSDSFWYPSTSSPLAGGDSITFDGRLVFHPLERDVSVTIRVWADSCYGDEFMPSYCRVDESSEANNVSATIPATLP